MCNIVHLRPTGAISNLLGMWDIGRFKMELGFVVVETQAKPVGWLYPSKLVFIGGLTGNF